MTIKNETSSAEQIELMQRHCAKNYVPYPRVFTEAKGVWLKDLEGRRYLDMLSAYSALNFGHCNDRLEQAAIAQLRRLTLTSRAFYNDQLGPMCRDLASLCGMEAVMPMNSGAEAVETAIKCARKWGLDAKGIDNGEIIVFLRNFHGRTTTIISFSDSEVSKKGFGPLTPGFVLVPFGDAQALREAVNKQTVAVLIEPIQGEGGVIIPPDGFLREVRRICTDNNILMLADEIQTGLCRTGAVFACEHEGVKPDVYIIGKSLGGGVTPLSAVVSSEKIMSVFTPGTHGSTFGGNAFACAIAREVIKIIREDHPEKAARELGEYFVAGLKKIGSKKVKEIRARGLLVGVDIHPEFGKAKVFAEKLLEDGVLSKDTRDYTIRFAPPLVIKKEEIDWGLEKIAKVLS